MLPEKQLDEGKPNTNMRRTDLATQVLKTQLHNLKRTISHRITHRQEPFKPPRKRLDYAYRPVSYAAWNFLMSALMETQG